MDRRPIVASENLLLNSKPNLEDLSRSEANLFGESEKQVASLMKSVNKKLFDRLVDQGYKRHRCLSDRNFYSKRMYQSNPEGVRQAEYEYEHQNILVQSIFDDFLKEISFYDEFFRLIEGLGGIKLSSADRNKIISEAQVYFSENCDKGSFENLRRYNLIKSGPRIKLFGVFMISNNFIFNNE